MNATKDKEELVVNPTTGKLDTVVRFNPDRIVTAQLNGAGNPRLIFDQASGTYIDDDATIVTDLEGNLVFV